MIQRLFGEPHTVDTPGSADAVTSTKSSAGAAGGSGGGGTWNKIYWKSTETPSVKFEVVEGFWSRNHVVKFHVSPA